jgi:hypothetical protein
MANSDVFALRELGLNEFLYSSIGIESNGMMLSVVSLFARLGRDPWREAGRLVNLPRPEAIDSLTQTIVDLPTSTWSRPDATAIAARLIAFLPTRFDKASAGSLAGNTNAMRNARMMFLLACIALATWSTFGLFTGHETPMPSDTNTAPVKSLATPLPEGVDGPPTAPVLDVRK